MYYGASGSPIALVAEVAGDLGPHYVLNATIDTAGFGDEEAWSTPPTSGMIRDGWLYGRGSADSKAGVAIFCHVAAACLERQARLRGTLKLIFDADEHTGDFSGMKHALNGEDKNRIAGAMLGYPGFKRVGIGARGFERAVVTVHGKAAHSGSSSNNGDNAIVIAAKLVDRLSSLALPSAGTAEFPLPPRISITMIEAGHGFSEIPDLCRLNVDIRLTPSFGRRDARAAVARVIEAAVQGADDAPRIEAEWHAGWPAYHLRADSVVASALTDSAQQVLRRPVEQAVVGPSSVGNLLFEEGIEATTGFGVAYQNIHGTDERIELASIPSVYDIYYRAVETLLG